MLSDDLEIDRVILRGAHVGLADRAHQVDGILDPDAVSLEDDVSATKSGSFRRRSFDHVRHEHTFGPHPQSVGQVDVQCGELSTREGINTSTVSERWKQNLWQWLRRGH